MSPKSCIGACKVIIKLLKIPIENCILPQFVKPESIQDSQKAKKKDKCKHKLSLWAWIQQKALKSLLYL